MSRPPDYRTYLLSAEWRLKRAAVLRRCFSICEECGKRKAAEIHHLTYARLGEERLDDLRALCRDCHQARHANLSMKRREG